MSWPYGVSFMNPAQSMNGMENICQPYFSNQIHSNQLLNPFAINFYNVAQNYTMFSNNCLDIQTNNVSQQINFIIQSDNLNNSGDLEE